MTATFSRHACWDNATVARTIQTEAVSASDAVFLATHSPLRIRRLSGADSQTTTMSTVTEKQVVDAFVTSEANAGVVVAPIIGESGSGKSHLVRWAYLNIEPGPSRRIIYLPKSNTPFKDVVLALIAEGHGELFDELREQVSLMGASMTSEVLGRRLLDELAERVLTDNEPRDAFERALVGPERLHALLRDPHFHGELTKPGSLIDRRASHALNGRVEGDEDVPLAFTIAELPISLAGVGKNASAQAKKIHSQIAAQPPVQHAAVDLLNRHLDSAMMAATSLGVGRVHEAFLRIRESMAGQAEIILLIEDFALIQGVQRDLLEAIIQTGSERGEVRLATVRTMMAVTSGYYEKLDETFRTRAAASSPRYQVDLAFDTSDGIADGTVADFVARYLNAARVGSDEIGEARDRHEAVPNACNECPFREPCHAAFGTSTEGYGLYPYNLLAVDRAARVCSGDQKDTGLFNPRATLAHAIRDVLIGSREEIEGGLFPGAAFENALGSRPDLPRLGLRARAQIEDADPSESSRTFTFLEYWGGVPKQATNLAPRIHEAFDLPPLELSEVQDDEPTTESPDSPTKPDTRLDRRLKDIEQWASGNERLGQELARDIREVVARAVISRLPSRKAEFISVTASTLAKRYPASKASISIEGAKEPGSEVLKAPLRFERNTANGLFFQSLLRRASGDSSDTAVHAARLDGIARSQAAQLFERDIERMEIDSDSLAHAVAVLIRGAQLCGGLPIRSGTAELARGVFWSREISERRDANLRIDKWMELEAQHLAERDRVIETVRQAIGVSQGTGAIQVVDGVRLRGLVRRAGKLLSAELGKTDLPQWAQAAWVPLTKLAALAPHQVNNLESVIGEVRDQLPAGYKSYRDTVAIVASAAEQAQSVGYVPTRDLATLRSDILSAGDLDFGQFAALESGLEALREGTLTVEAVAGADWHEAPGLVRRFLSGSSDWVDRGLVVAEDRTNVDADDYESHLDSVLAMWTTLLGSS